MKKIFLTVYAALLVVCQENHSPVDITTLLSDGDNLINLNSEPRVIVFMGTTGTGKSTLLKFVLHDENLEVIEDEGYIVFSDKGETISNDTLSSKTLLPNIRRDLETGIVLADCPGFSDTRSTELEIASTYYIKKVLESAKEIKIILVENHYSFGSGNDRTRFTNLLSHVAKLIPDIEYFRGSIGLVATKFDLNLSNEKAIGYILNFFNRTKRFLDDKLQNNNNNSQQDFKPWRKMADVLDILWGDFSGSNIALFRRPVEVGYPWNSTVMLNNYESLRKLVFNSTKFAQNERGIFKYSLSSDSLLLIKGKWLDKYKDSVANCFQTFTSEFEISFTKRIEQIPNMNSKLKFIRVLYDMLKTFDNKFKFLHDLLDTYHDFLKEIQTQIYKPNFQNDLLHSIDQAEFFYSVADESLSPIILKIRDIFTVKIVQIVENYHLLYQYLELVETGLLQYDIQSKRSVYYNNIKSFTDKKSFRNLILKLPDMNITASLTTSVSSANVTEQYFAQFRDLLTHNLNYTISNNMIGSKLFIEGYNLILSEVKSILANYTYYSEVNLFAFNNLYIDEDVSLEDAHLNIIAPYIYVVKKVDIKLVGRKVEDYYKAQNSNSRTKAGNAGRAGIPGANSGNLLIVSLRVFHQERLTISSIGGQGGKGEDGGDGFDGKASPIPNIKEIEGYKDDIYSKIKSMGYDYLFAPSYAPYAIPVPIIIVTSVTTFDYFILGVNNTQENGLPTKGGDGGVAGIGGKPGDIHVITKHTTNIRTYVRNGSPGLPGLGGRGGKGKASCALKLFYCHAQATVAAVLVVPVVVQTKYYYYCNTRTNEKCYSSFCDIGTYCDNYLDEMDGISGNSTFLQQNEKSIDGITLKDVLHLYKNFTLSYKMHKYHQEIYHFLDFFQNADSILKSYSTMEYLKDIFLIESELSFSINNVEQLRFYYGNMYESFVSAKRYGFVKNSIETYLVNLLLISKLEDIRSLQENKIIIDLEGYIDQRLSVLAQIKSDGLISHLYARSEAYFKKSIKIIEENQLLIDDEFGKRLSKKIEEADTSIEKMSIEISKLRQDRAANIEKLFDLENQLNNNIRNRAIFGTVNVFKSVLDVFKPAASTALGAIIDITERSVIKNVDVKKETAVKNLPPGIEFGKKVLHDVITNSMLSMKNKTMAYINIVMKLKDFVTKNFNETDSTVSKLLKDITKISNSLNNSISERNENILEAAFTVDEIFSQSDNIISVIQEEFLTNATNDEILTEINEIKRFTTLIPQMSRSVVSTLQKYENDEQSLKLIYEAIEKNGEMIKELNKYEKSLFQFIQPLFDNISDTLKKFTNNLSGKTYFLLQFQKLDIKSHLKEVLTFVSRFTQGFEAGEDLTQIITDLESLIYTVIDAYDKINELEYKLQLAKFITNANSPDFRDTVINNSNYSAMFANVNKLISSNMLIAEYNSIFQAFKQHAFPFISKFTNYLNFDTFDLGNEKLITEKTLLVMDGIEKINKQLVDMKTQINEGTDSIMHTAEFYSHSALNSFFKWPNREYRKIIQNFLRGDQITLLADVRKVQHLNAVKFRKLQLNITSNDQSLNSNLHQQLTGLQVEMRHVGESHYKCDLKYFAIRGNSFTITHSFDTNKNGIPTSKNSVYDKIIAGDISLSPYTLWKFQLKPLPGHFMPDLSQYFDKVDLEFVGTGQYISEGSEICATPLEMYYMKR